MANKSKLETATSRFIDLADDLVFVPSPPQRKTKAKFWLAARDYPQSSPETVGSSEALRVTGDRRLERWWKAPGFKEWFRGQDEFRERVEYLCQLALDTAEEILLVDDPRATNAKVAMIKVLMEAGGKITRAREIKLLDESIQKMNKLQLEEYIKRAQPVLKEASNDKKSEETSGDSNSPGEDI